MGAGYLLGIDIGTYESKGVLTTTGGEIVASASIGHNLSIPQPGWAEHDAEDIWWHDFVFLCRGLLSSSQTDPHRILGVGVSAIAPCVLPIDRDGKPLRPAILYGLDTRASQEIVELEQELGRQQIFANSGLHLSSQAAGPKILWIRKHEPQIWQKTHMILTGSGYLVYKLTGETVLDLYTATGYTPLLDIHHLRWSEEMALPITPLERLPRLIWTVDVAGKVSRDAARETGLAPGTPVIAGTADAAAEALSAGLSQPGDLMIMYGSSIFFIQKTAKLVTTECMWSAVFLEAGTYALAGGMSTGGSLTRWFRDQFAPDYTAVESEGGVLAYEQLAQQAADSPLGGRGLVTLPYFSGERTPFYDPQARGVIAGLSLTHRRADVYRSILEGVGFGIRHNIEVMRAEGVPPQRFLAIGGGTKNLPWLQMVSDIANIEQWVPQRQKGACYGDAFLAGIGAGVFSGTDQILEWVKSSTCMRPDPENHARYQPYYQIFSQLYEQNAHLMHRLAELGRL